MKSLKNYILEGHSSPDKINFVEETPTGDIIRMFSWNSQAARPFLYGIKINRVIFGMPTATHADIVRGIRQKDMKLFKELGLHTALSNVDVRWDPTEWDEQTEQFKSYDAWAETHKEIAARLRTGRVWDVRLYDDDGSDNFKPALFIAWWDELSGKEFVDYNTAVVDRFFELKLDHGDPKEDYIFYCVDNNGDIFTYDLKKKDAIKVDKRSEESKILYRTAKAIHNASQEEKKKFFADFKKSRDERNQKIYNHTKSKTEAEYRALKYQESLEV